MQRRHQILRVSWIALVITAAAVITLSSGTSNAQEVRGPVSIRVRDEAGGVIAGAQIKLIDGAGRERSAITDQEGQFVFADVPFGNYTLRVNAEHFRLYEDQHILVGSTAGVNMTTTLNVAGVEESLSVFPDTSVAQVAEYVGGSLVIRGDALMALDTPGGLEAFLRAMALRTSGPFGPVALVNGFEDGQLPPTYSIREIRINDNSFSAEFATLGLGRIEILTKPGTEDLHFMTFGTLGHTNLNSRNPFAPEKAHYQSTMYGGNISGPILRRKAAFFVDFSRQQVDTNALINATIVDSAFQIVPLRQTIVTPQLRKSFSPRLDYQMGKNHTWILRYADSRSHSGNAGVGEFSLLSRAQDWNGRVQTFQLTETAVLNSKAINETRAQFVRTKSVRFGNSLLPAINIQEGFVGGGADIGYAYNRQNLAELHNVLSLEAGKHSLKAGLQGRFLEEIDGTNQNFNGTYTFATRIGPQLDSSDQIVTDANGDPRTIPVSTIEAYRRTVLFRAQGLSPAEIRTLGGGASQFSITAGQVQTAVRQYQGGAFVQDNWRLHPNFTLSSGVRLETQRDASRKVDFAPRISFAWGLGHGKTVPLTVLRGGVGMFYDRIAEGVILRARQLDGLRQRQYFVSDSAILDLFPTVPTPDVFAQFAIPQSTVRLASDLQTPYTVNSSLALERHLAAGFSVAVTASYLRGMHLLRSRNVNAPLPGTYDPDFPQQAVRPLGSSTDTFQYESSGVFDQRQLLMNVVYRAAKDVALWSTYTLSNSKSDTDSPDTFPANSYDLRSEYGRSASQARHTFYWGGWIRTKGGVDLTPLVLWRSRTPFDITSGRDTNGDSLFMDRPAFATDLTRPSVVRTELGNFDLSPLPGQQIIPRNYGYSRNFFIANLRVGKRFPIGDKLAVTLSLQGTNILNHTNPGAPVGNLGSTVFGRAITSAGDWGLGSNQAGNRRIEAMLYFDFR